MSQPRTWSVEELHRELGRSEEALRRAGKAENTVRTYVDRSRYFVRWLDGEYVPASSG